MFKNTRNPNWWILYGLIFVILVLFAIEESERISSTGHIILGVLIIILLYGTVWEWLKGNEIALMREDQERYWKLIGLKLEDLPGGRGEPFRRATTRSNAQSKWSLRRTVSAWFVALITAVAQFFHHLLP